MKLFAPRRPARAVLGVTLLVAGLCVGHTPAHLAHAAEACRTDPVLVVNGATVDIVATLWTNSANVKEVDYVVTVPAGSLINKTTLTVGLGFPERVIYAFSATQAWGTIKVATTVQTQVGVQPFQTIVTATSPLSLLTGSTSASGLSTATVTVNVGHLVMV